MYNQLIEQEEPFLIKALPDLVIGLIGIPAAFSLQSIFQSAYESDNHVTGFGWFFIVALFYSLFPFLFFLYFDALRMRYGEIWWESRNNFFWLAFMVFLSFVAVGLIFGLGATFDGTIKPSFNLTIQPLRRTFYLAYLITYYLAHLPIVFREDLLVLLRRHRPWLSNAYLFGTILGLVLGFVLLFSSR